MSVYHFPYGSAASDSDCFQSECRGYEYSRCRKHEASNDNVVRFEPVENGTLFGREGEAEKVVAQILDAGQVGNESVRHDGRFHEMHVQHCKPLHVAGEDAARACTDAATREFQSLNLSGCNGFQSVSITSPEAQP